MSELLFDYIFNIMELDPDGKKYEKVSRVVAHGRKCDMHLLLDLNTEIYPMNKNERFLLALAPLLVLNTKDGLVPIQVKFEYIMHGNIGRVHDIVNEGGSKPGPEVEVYESFGGLQMLLRGHAC